MILSKRERYIALAAIGALALLVADRYVLTPITDLNAQAVNEVQALTGELELASSLFLQKGVMVGKWNKMVAGGLKMEAGEAESQVLHAMQDWAGDAGLDLWSIKPERLDQGEDLREIVFQAAATGPMSAVSRFLWLVETTSIPLRIKEMQLGSRREGTDLLSLQLRVSTLYLAVSQPAAKGEQGPAQRGVQQ